MDNTERIEEIVCRKRQIRKEVLARRDRMTINERKIASYRLADKVIGHQWFYRSEIVLCFVSCGSEIDTTEIIQEAFRTGRKVFVPKTEGNMMNFYRICSMEELTAGYRGILEPDGKSERYIYKNEEVHKTLMIMPGVAFDPYRNRIGYGKGYYDRYLADKPLLQLRTIAIGFQCQMTEQIPCEETDIRPYQVLTV